MSLQNNPKNFIKTLNLFDATAIVAGAMIGSGVFIVSSDIAKDVQSAGLLLLVWLLSGVLTMIGAISYGEYAATWPEAGGQYVYIRKIWGEMSGFVYGWSLFLVIQTGSIAAVAIAFAKFLGILCPFINTSNHLISVYGFSVSSLQLIAIILIISLTGINLKGVKFASRIQNTVTVTNIIALAGIILCGIFIGANPGIISANFSNAFAIPDLNANLYSIIGITLVGGLFAFDGWNNLTFIAAEIKNTEKNLPLALLLGTGVVTFLYILTNLVYLSVLSVNDIGNATNGIVGATFMEAIFGDFGKVIISIIILIAAFGCVNSMVLAGPRVLYAMAKDGLFFKKLAVLGKKSNVPENSLYLQCIWSIVLVLSGTFSQLLDYFIFASLIFYMMTIGGLFIFRKKYPDIPRQYKAWGYPYLPIFYCVVCLFIEINLLIYKPLHTWPGLIIVFTGIPVYLFWKKISKPVSLSEISEETQENS
jgi:APA family basic amino acid/polyamine antiporter